MGKWYNNRVEYGIWEWSEEFDCREDAIEDGIEQYKKALEGEDGVLFGRDDDELNPSLDAFFIGESNQFIPYIDARYIIEILQEDAYCECGEVADNFLDEYSVENYMVKDLQENLNNTINNWLEKYDLVPTFYSLINTEKIQVKDYL